MPGELSRYELECRSHPWPLITSAFVRVAGAAVTIGVAEAIVGVGAFVSAAIGVAGAIVGAGAIVVG